MFNISSIGKNTAVYEKIVELRRRNNLLTEAIEKKLCEINSLYDDIERGQKEMRANETKIELLQMENFSVIPGMITKKEFFEAMELRLDDDGGVKIKSEKEILEESETEWLNYLKHPKQYKGFLKKYHK